MNAYVKHEGRRTEVDTLHMETLGTSMLDHGQDFASDSEFGSCLKGMCSYKHHTVTQVLTW
jgi:hypothetical protein